MAKFWRTYYPTAGTKFIQDPDLAYATKIFTVHRSGKSYDPGAGGNREFTYDSPNGKILFADDFNDGETVRVWWESNGGPAPICTPVTAEIIFPTGIDGVSYNYDVQLTGTAPFSLTVNEKPSWATVQIAGDHLQVFGTPDAEGVVQIDITITNCNGGGVLNYAQDIQIYAPPDPVEPDTDGSMQISVAAPFAKITNVAGFSYTLSSGSLPLSNGQSAVGVFTTFVGQVKVTVSQVVTTVKLQLIRNDIVLQEKTITAGFSSVQTFISFSFNSTHVMKIKLISA